MRANVKFTSSPWGFRFQSFARYCQFMSQAGISHICTIFGDPAQMPLAFRADEAELGNRVQVASEWGLTIVEIATTTANYAQEIPLAAVAGASYLRIVDVWRNDEGTFRQVTSSLREIGRLAASLGITIIVENHGGLLATGSSSRRFFEEISLESVKLNYDPANYLYHGEDPLVALEQVLPFVAFTHCKSVRYENGKPRYCRVAQGVIDYKRIFDKLLPGYQGFIGLEYEEASDVEAGTLDDLRYLKDLEG